ncbi:MAG: putative 2OG-Fe(II) oxygenase [Pseudomonadales bacterium]|jgi:hypothetical protein
MAITEYDIQPLFATPYFRANIAHAISDEQIAYVQDLKMIKNRDNYISENLYIFEDPKLLSFKIAIQEALDIYANEVMGISQKLYVTQSWALVNQTSVGMHSHSHSNSIVSGSLYYCDLPEPVSRVIFDKHTMYQQLELNPLKDKQNLFNTPVNVVTPKTREVLMFPSDLTHQIEPNGASTPRYTIAFNTFIKGKLGNYRDVSELAL